MTFQGALQNVRLLIIDDDDVAREKCRRLLEHTKLALEIVEAASAQEARDLLERTSFDCVLLDYLLGDGVGLDLIAKIKSHRKVPCPIIMITGRGGERVAVEAIREGVYDYLSKAQLTPLLIETAIQGSIHAAELERRLQESYERLHRLSMFDNLTGVPNRNLFSDRLEQAILATERGGVPFAVLMMDLDGFKAVNDRLGHQAGDVVLEQVAARLQTLLRDSDTIARWGGDEFAALLMGTDSVEGAVVTAERMIERLADPIWTGEEIAHVGISIGIALFAAHGRDSKTLLANADHAMYRAKYRRSGFAVHEERPPEAPALRQTSLISQALERNELFLEYQPKIDLASRNVIGIEALVRWRSPQLGVLSPAQFIPAAEKTAVIRPMTYTIIDMALAQVVSWQQTHGIFLPVAVNLSAVMLEDRDLSKRVSDSVHRHGLASVMLMLDITECALETNPSRRQTRLHELIECGIQISIDDFGTGLTSLKYLREIDISEIKIDGLFVNNLSRGSRDASIVRSITTLARGIDVPVVAEGMEHAACWDPLVELGCNVGQGFHICPPIEAERLPAWMASWDRQRQAAAPSAWLS